MLILAISFPFASHGKSVKSVNKECFVLLEGKKKMENNEAWCMHFVTPRENLRGIGFSRD